MVNTITRISRERDLKERNTCREWQKNAPHPPPPRIHPIMSEFIEPMKQKQDTIFKKRKVSIQRTREF